MKKLIFLLCLSVLAIACDTKKDTPVKKQEIVFTKNGELTLFKSSGKEITTIAIEIADTDYKRELGLMHRNSMEEQQGMLFIFPHDFPRSFYMKNTYIPLDLIFIDSNNKIVSFRENAIPLDESSLTSEVPAKYVLEVNAGLAEKWLLEVGDHISFSKN